MWIEKFMENLVMYQQTLGDIFTATSLALIIVGAMLGLAFGVVYHFRRTFWLVASVGLGFIAGHLLMGVIRLLVVFVLNPFFFVPVPSFGIDFFLQNILCVFGMVIGLLIWLDEYFG